MFNGFKWLLTRERLEPLELLKLLKLYYEKANRCCELENESYVSTGGKIIG
jgi:hypothetical protein